MEIKDFECPFCEEETNYNVNGIQFEENHILMDIICNKCNRNMVLDSEIEFKNIRIYIKPKEKEIEKEIENLDN